MMMDILSRTHSLQLTHDELNEILSSIPSLSYTCSLLAYPDDDSNKVHFESMNLTTYLENAWKYGCELIGEPDPFSAAINIFSRSAVGNVLSKLSTSQCAGLMGLFISTVAPQVKI